MSRSSLSLAFAVLLVLVGFGVVAFGGAASDPAVTEVKIDNFTMSPEAITVAAGSTVRWTNADDIPHTVVSEDRTFTSKVIDTDQQFSFTFEKPGTYKYFCSIHPHMTGTVIVK